MAADSVGRPKTEDGGAATIDAATGENDDAEMSRCSTSASSTATNNILASDSRVARRTVGTTPAREKRSKRKRRSGSSAASRGSGRPSTRQCHSTADRCCDCTRHSTCRQGSTANKAGCSCRDARRQCRSCTCYRQCTNKASITSATGSLAAFVVPVARAPSSNPPPFGCP